MTHVAGAKVLYASAAFNDFETRLRDVTERTIQIGSNWNEAKQYLEESNEYWLAAIRNLGDKSLDDMVPTNWGDSWPIWRILDTVTSHDHYHAGQIALTRAVAPFTEEPPPPLSEAEIDFLKTFSAW